MEELMNKMITKEKQKLINKRVLMDFSITLTTGKTVDILGFESMLMIYFLNEKMKKDSILNSNIVTESGIINLSKDEVDELVNSLIDSIYSIYESFSNNIIAIQSCTTIEELEALNL